MDLKVKTRRSAAIDQVNSVTLNENANSAKEASGNVQEITKDETVLVHHAKKKFTHIEQVTKQLKILIDQTSNKITEITHANNSIVDSVTQLSATSEEVTASSEQAYDLCCHNLECVEKETDLLREIDELIRKFQIT